LPVFYNWIDGYVSLSEQQEEEVVPVDIDIDFEVPLDRVKSTAAIIQLLLDD